MGWEWNTHNEANNCPTCDFFAGKVFDWKIVDFPLHPGCDCFWLPTDDPATEINWNSLPAGVIAVLKHSLLSKFEATPEVAKLPTFIVVAATAGRIRATGNRPGNIVITQAAVDEAPSRLTGRPVFLDHAPLKAAVRDMAGQVVESWVTGQSLMAKVELYPNVPAGAIATNAVTQYLEAEKPLDIGFSLVAYPRLEKGQLLSFGHIESCDIVFEPATDSRPLLKLASEENMPEAEQNNLNEWLGALSKTTAQAMITQANLPAGTMTRLMAGTYNSPADVTAAIKAAREELSANAPAGTTVNLSSNPPRTRLSVGPEPIEQLKLAAEALIGGVMPPAGVQPLTGIRELYIALSGDFNMSGVFQPENITRFAAVNSTTMAGIVANALNKRVVTLYAEYPKWWTRIVSEEDFTSLQQVKWITLGGVGELPTIDEGQSYTEMSWDDQTETASFVKKGGYLGLTLEAIDKDDTRRIMVAPRAIAQAAWLTLSKSISSIFTANSGVGATMSDGIALFNASHSNLGSTALSHAAWVATRTAMRKQTELNSSERLGQLVAPKYLLVPPDLEATALQVIGGEYVPGSSNLTINPFADGDMFMARLEHARSRVIVIDLWTDTDNWAAVADPMLYQSIGLGYRYGRQPEVMSVADPNAGLMFTNDTMPIKVRFFYATGASDWRGLYKHNV